MSKAENVAAEIIEVANDLQLNSGGGPTDMAAAATYIASVLAGEKKTQREVANVANVTELTITNLYKELMEKLEIRIKL